MKKLLILMTLFIAVACSKTEDNQSEIENTTLLKTMVDGDQTISFSYNGFKLAEITNVGAATKQIFTYEGDLITYIKDFNIATNKTVNIKSYTYENNKLKTFTNDEVGQDFITKYTYTNEPDGTVSYINNEINKTTQNEELKSSGVLTFTNGVLTQDDTREIKYPACTNVYSRGYVNEYDDKNSFFKNIIGLDKIYDIKNMCCKRNLLKNYEYVRTGARIGDDPNHVLTTENGKPETRTYSYNTSDYPTECNLYDAGSVLIRTIKYVYE